MAQFNYHATRSLASATRIAAKRIGRESETQQRIQRASEPASPEKYVHLIRDSDIVDGVSKIITSTSRE